MIRRWRRSIIPRAAIIAETEAEEMTDEERFLLVLRGVAGKRLTYAGRGDDDGEKNKSEERNVYEKATGTPKIRESATSSINSSNSSYLMGSLYLLGKIPNHSGLP